MAQYTSISNVNELMGAIDSNPDRSELLCKLKEILQRVNMDERKEGCPGFKLVQPFDSQESADPQKGYHNTGAGSYTVPLPSVDYDPTSKLPFTTVCDHNPCFLESEYEYFLTYLVAQGMMTGSNWENLRPIREFNVTEGQPLSLPAGKN